MRSLFTASIVALTAQAMQMKSQQTFCNVCHIAMSAVNSQLTTNQVLQKIGEVYFGKVGVNRPDLESQQFWLAL